MPILLYLDTSGPKATIALSRNAVLLASSTLEDTKEQAALVNVVIKSVLEHAGLILNKIDAVCVCGGPGSYTGLRVGLGVAKGIAFALDKKLMLFDRLSLIARSLTGADWDQKEKLVILKARKGEYFFAHFAPKQTIIAPPNHIFAEALFAKINQLGNDIICITDDENLPLNRERYILKENFKLNLKAWIDAAEQRVLNKDWDDLAYSEPYYLKAAFTTQSKKWKA